MNKIFKCLKCNKYTLKGTCGGCGEKTISTKPPKFSQENRWGKYRRKYKNELEA